MVEKAGAVSFAGTVPALLYRTLQKNSVEQAYIEAMWGDPYLHTITHWAAIPQERRENLTKEYPEMQDLAEEVDEDRRDFLDKFDNFNDTPAGQFLNNMGFALSAVAAVHPVGRGAVCAARIGVTVAAGLPKVVKAITALGALEIAREFSILCNKKSGGDPKARTIPTHNAQRDFIDAKVKSGEWKKMKGRFMFEDKKGLRYAPTKEKYEIEVGKKVEGVWQHIGIIRAEGEKAGVILEKFAKGKNAGHYFK